MGRPDDQFHLVGKVISEEKYFDTSLAEIMRQHASSRKVQLGSTIEVFDDNVGESVDVYIVLKLSGHDAYPLSWDAALAMHNRRVDGFGHEEDWESIDRTQCSGWHRHRWSSIALNADGKMPVDCFQSAVCYQHFVTTALREMNITLSGRDDGPYDMF